jgi:hypothetical protein
VKASPVDFPPLNEEHLMSHDTNKTEPAEVDQLLAGARDALRKARAFYCVVVLDEGDTYSVESYLGGYEEGADHVVTQQVLEDFRALGLIEELPE